MKDILPNTSVDMYFLSEFQAWINENIKIYY